jgi:hypothetical protein
MTAKTLETPRVFHKGKDGRPTLGSDGRVLTVQKSFTNWSVFYPYLSKAAVGAVTPGIHSNTSWVSYSGNDYLKCLHLHGNLTGVYTSEIFDLTSSDRYLVYILADIVVIGTGTTWSAQVASPVKWSDVSADTRSWADIFEPLQAPQVTMNLKYGDSSPPANTVRKMEILSTVVTGRYFQVEITIIDPTPNIYALVENFELKFCQ